MSGVRSETAVMTLSEQRRMSRESHAQNWEERKMVGGEQRQRGKEPAEVEEQMQTRGSVKPMQRDWRDVTPLIMDSRFTEIEKQAEMRFLPLEGEQAKWADEDWQRYMSERNLRLERLRVLEEKEMRKPFDKRAAILARDTSRDVLDAFHEAGYIRPSKISRYNSARRIEEQRRHLGGSFGRSGVRRHRKVPVEEWYSISVPSRGSEFRSQEPSVTESGAGTSGASIAREPFESEVAEKKDPFYQKEEVPITEHRNPNIDPSGSNISEENPEYAAGGVSKGMSEMEGEVYKGPTEPRLQSEDVSSSSSKKPIPVSSGHKPAGRR